MKFNYYKITNIKNNKIYIGITEEEYYKIKPITLIE